MKMHLATALAVCALLTTGRTATAQLPPGGEPDPEAIARRCMEHISSVAERCIERNGQVAQRCVAEIGELLEAGEPHKARRLARHCKGVINHQTEDCLHHLWHDCHHCVAVLTFLGAEELADEVEAHCHAAAERVNFSRRSALEAIDEALQQAPAS